jgi:hypothetical protein
MEREEEMGRCCLGTTDTNIPEQAGSKEAPQNSTSHKHTTNDMKFVTSTAIVPNVQPNIPDTIETNTNAN